LASVDVNTKEPLKRLLTFLTYYCSSRRAVIGEAMVALVLADAMREKFGGDSLKEMKRNYNGYLEQLKEY